MKHFFEKLYKINKSIYFLIEKNINMYVSTLCMYVQHKTMYLHVNIYICNHKNVIRSIN